MREKILNDLKEAMKNKDKEKLAVIRMIKGAMQMEELNLKRECTDDEMIGIISKQIKTRKESMVEFEKAGRTDLMEQTQKEIDFLNTYMPEQLSEEEILKEIDQVFQEVNPSSVKDMGKLMGLLTPKLKGKADMSWVSKTIREKLNNL
ncbi:MAG TPA: GatB/YqeY domain-containing protein [Candidatus Pelethosoma merdigallinarum]|nr:GatB/YqeY domain-containing protein [Candidatus Pelethosoma merdigallinarum]